MRNYMKNIINFIKEYFLKKRKKKKIRNKLDELKKRDPFIYK